MLTSLRMTPLVEAVVIPFVSKLMDYGRGSAQVKVTPEVEAAADTMLDALAASIPVGRFARAAARQ